MNFAGVQSVTIPEGDVKSIAIGGVTVWQKPNPLPYDALVEYVESTGAQYVDTGVLANQTARVEITLQAIRIAKDRGVFGYYYNGTNSLYLYMGNANPAVWQFGFGSYGNSPRACDTSVHQFVLANYSLSIDGVVVSTLPSRNFSLQKPLTLFKTQYGDGSYYSATPIKLFSAKIYTSGTLVRDFQPVRVGTEGALYDRVTDTIFRSATSTPLVAGPDKNGG